MDEAVALLGVYTFGGELCSVKTEYYYLFVALGRVAGGRLAKAVNCANCAFIGLYVPF